MLTMLSSHAIGAARRRRRLIGLTHGFTWGALTMTALLVASVAYIAAIIWRDGVPVAAWSVVCGILAGLGVAVWAFYYRRAPGTSLWLPRPMAKFLSRRARAADNTPEAFSLGLVSVLAEILFIAGPILTAALVMIHLAPLWQMVALGLYAIVATSSLIVVNALIGSGHRISRIQAWREQNKRFLQFAAGAGLLVLSAYLYADIVINTTGIW